MATKKDATDRFDYTALSTELDALLERLESGGLDVDEAVGCYERGLAIITSLQAHLGQAEHRVTKLHDALGGTAE